MGSVVISVRVPREVKEKLEKYGVNVSEVVRSYLKEYVEELEMKELGRLLDELKEKLSGKVDPRLVARLVREDRVRR